MYYHYINGIILHNTGNHSTTVNKMFWSFVKLLRKENIDIPTVLDGNVEVSQRLGKTELLSKQFKSVFTQDPNSSLPDKGPSLHPNVHSFNITEGGVFKLVFTLNIFTRLVDLIKIFNGTA